MVWTRQRDVVLGRVPRVNYLQNQSALPASLNRNKVCPESVINFISRISVDDSGGEGIALKV